MLFGKALGNVLDTGNDVPARAIRRTTASPPTLHCIGRCAADGPIFDRSSCWLVLCFHGPLIPRDPDAARLCFLLFKHGTVANIDVMFETESHDNDRLPRLIPVCTNP